MDEPQRGARVGERIVARVGHPDHQSRLAVVHRHGGFLGEDKASARAREPREDQSRHDGEQRHPDKDFRRCDNMAEMGLRMHIAVSDRRKRLDGEIE